jgi:hypothetical protein
VAGIDETMAHRYFSDRSPLGQYLDLDGGAKAKIIGIIGDVHQVRRREAVEPQYYCPYWQRPKYDTYALAVLLKATGDPGPGSETQIPRAMYEAAPEVVAANITPLSQAADATLRVGRYTLILLPLSPLLERLSSY